MYICVLCVCMYAEIYGVVDVCGVYSMGVCRICISVCEVICEVNVYIWCVCARGRKK